MLMLALLMQVMEVMNTLLKLLLDALTIKNRFNNFSKLQIAICGDILHSRVARSNIIILSKLGAKINVIGPRQWLPNKYQ